MQSDREGERLLAAHPLLSFIVTLNTLRPMSHKRFHLGCSPRLWRNSANDDIRASTKAMYHSLWCNFNKFLLGFDDLPTTWEDKMVLCASFLADIGNSSATVSSYMSAIRYVLRHDGMEINDNNCKLSAIIRSCKLRNDVVAVRRPIRKGLLKLILKSVDKRFSKSGQPYLAILYKALFSATYYGLFRISELVGRHAMMVGDVHVSKNLVKRKVKFIVRSSKTLIKGKKPQAVDVVPDIEDEKTNCDPFILIAEYSRLRPLRSNQMDQYFVFSDGSEVKPHHLRAVLKKALSDLNLPPAVFNFHGWRSGRATDLFKKNYSIAWIKKIGRWSRKSTAVFAYFK